MRAGPEARLQKAVVAFLSVALPDDAEWLVIPGGDGRRTNPNTHYRPGSPDMLVIYQGHAMAFELKGPKGALRASQRDLAYKLFKAGCTTHVCRSVQAVEEALRLSGVPLKATTGATLEAAAREQAV